MSKYQAKTAIYDNNQYLSKAQDVLNLSGSLVTTFARRNISMKIAEKLQVLK